MHLGEISGSRAKRVHLRQRPLTVVGQHIGRTHRVDQQNDTEAFQQRIADGVEHTESFCTSTTIGESPDRSLKSVGGVAS